MPTTYINTITQKTGKSKEELETLWKRAKEQAEKQGHKDDYDYITAIFKKMVGVKESIIIIQDGLFMLL